MTAELLELAVLELTDPDARIVGALVLVVSDGHAGPTQLETQEVPLHKVVNEDDRLEVVEADVVVGTEELPDEVTEGLPMLAVLVAIVPEVTSVGVLVPVLEVEDGHNDPTQTDTHRAPLQEELDEETTLEPVPDVGLGTEELPDEVVEGMVRPTVLEVFMPDEVTVAALELIEEVEHPGPTQTDTHRAPLQEVVSEEDRLELVTDNVLGSKELPDVIGVPAVDWEVVEEEYELVG